MRGLPQRARSKQTTHRLNPLLEKVTITHTFHPLCGQTFTLLKVKEVNGTLRYSLQTDASVICVPESWTAQRPPRHSDTSGMPFDALDLKELVQFLRTLDGFLKAPANNIDNSESRE